ncbi:MAG: protein-L-isoaspartate O-methyltransferase [Firmicutes bacterium HGW-Firmicutes-14]|nr:MAG: protein-L-isoaspartate O-methyltransferase [Firmicutes bacterium HGW-Firmicutes-14]
MNFTDTGAPPPAGRGQERRIMVEEQIAARGVNNTAVLDSMLAVPRHLFVPPDVQDRAYEDKPLPIGQGQTISQPFMVALMAEALEPKSTDRILEIGTGSGYAAAVLSGIVSRVFTVERHETIARQAGSCLKELGYNNVRVKVGDGTKGWPEEAPFDGIQVTAGAPGIPQSLCEQLKPGGYLVIPVGDSFFQELVRIKRTADGFFIQESLGTVRFVPLIGEEGWVP